MTQQRAMDTRAVLVSSAATEFAHHGYAASSINDILVGAACTKGAMYHHFTSKQQLAEAVVRAATGIYDTLAQRWLSAEQVHPLAALAGLVDDAATAFIAEPVLQAETRLSLEPQFADRAAAQVWENAVAQLVTDAAALGCLRTGFTADKTARVLIGRSQEIGYWRSLHHRRKKRYRFGARTPRPCRPWSPAQP